MVLIMQDSQLKLIKNVHNKNKQSSPREFFERIYGNSENLNSFYLTKQLFFGENSRSEHNCGLIKDNRSSRSGSLYGSNTSLELSTPLYTTAPVDSLSRGLTAFFARKKRKEGKVRRQRTTFSNEQTLHLENEFRVNEYITRNRTYELAKYLHLTEMQIKIWFQNRRAKDKRIEKAQLDQHYRNLIIAQRYFGSSFNYSAPRT